MVKMARALSGNRASDKMADKEVKAILAAMKKELPGQMENTLDKLMDKYEKQITAAAKRVFKAIPADEKEDSELSVSDVEEDLRSDVADYGDEVLSAITTGLEQWMDMSEWKSW